MTFLNRNQWGATTPQGPAMRTPIKTVFIHHTVTAATSNPAADMRGLDRIGRSRFGMFSYSYVIHPDGTSMEGAGLRRGAHTGGYNSVALGIAFIGNFQNEGPTKEAIFAAAGVMQYLKAGGVLTSNFSLRPHQSVKSTACPGTNLLNSMGLLSALAHAPAQPAAPQPPAKPAKPADPAAIRRYAAGALAGTLAGQPDMVGQSVGLHVVVLQQALNLIMKADIKEDGHYGQQTIDAVLAFQRFFKVAQSTNSDAGDFPGAAQRFTRWTMVTILRQISEGQG